MIDLASANVDDELDGSVTNPALELDMNAEASLNEDSRTWSFRQILQNISKFLIPGDFEAGLDFGPPKFIRLLLVVDFGDFGPPKFIRPLLVGVSFSATNDTAVGDIAG